MSSLWTIAGYLGHGVAAALLVSLAILTSRREAHSGEVRLLVVALVLTALWSLRHAFAGLISVGIYSDGIAETLRNAAWLAVLGGHIGWHRTNRDGSRHGRPLVLGALALILVAQLGYDMIVGETTQLRPASLPFYQGNWLLRGTFAIGALILLHGLTNQRDHPADARRRAWIGGALACMWAYDFNHYMLAWLTNGQIGAIGPMRGFVLALIALMLVLGLRSDGTREFALSRAVITRFISGGLVALYVLVVVALVAFSSEISAPFGRVVQFSALFALAVAVLAFLPSASLRSWLRMAISKHVFAHRYDYRLLWLRFAATLDDQAPSTTSIDARLTRAIAQAVDSPSAALYLCDGDGVLALSDTVAWPDTVALPDQLSPAVATSLAQESWIVDLNADWARFGPMLPAWMQRSSLAWAIAPLIHREQLIGAILLAAPAGRRTLDWEDMDVLRVVCGEGAARISEERSRDALAEAQRFDEFNRRFAFILHDLKNLVSQMSLLASNARRHADNPDFRTDMILTLEETAGRMTDLLVRLGRPGASGYTQALMLHRWVEEHLPGWTAGLGSVVTKGAIARPVAANGDALSRALSHLVRNAIEASAGAPVEIGLMMDDGQGIITVTDKGAGMSAAFMRDELFRPFSSTKANGFGLGAHEARLLVQSMGGALTVESVEGEGSCFTIRLPFANDAAVEAQARAPALVRGAG